MYQFFPSNFMWSQALNRSMFTGGSYGEISWAATRLAEAAEVYDNDAWFEVLHGLGDRLQARGRDQEGAGHTISACGSYLRAYSYHQWSIAFMEHSDERRGPAYQSSLDDFADFARLSHPEIERVEVPYEGTSFPAWFVPARTTEERAPAAVYLPGWDSTKEQGIEFALAQSERGMATLLCDPPGCGEAVGRGLVNRHDYEVPSTAALEYLYTRSNVDPDRIPVVGLSLGGYRAARAAAFEHRFVAAVAWGAIWHFGHIWANFRDNPRGDVPTPTAHALAVMGAETLDEVAEKLELWTLEGVADKIRCPLLILHGEDDALIPSVDAERFYESAGSTEKELRVFTRQEGGSAHCQNDNRIVAHDYMGDWLSDLLHPRPATD